MVFSLGFSVLGILLSLTGLLCRGRYRADGLAVAGLIAGIAALAAGVWALLV